MTVVGDRRPEDAAVGEVRQLLRRRAGRGGARPQVLGALSIGDVVDRLAVARPHGPHVLAVAGFTEPLVARRRSVVQQPQLALVEMAVTLAPPLARGGTTRRERDGRSVRRGRT